MFDVYELQRHHDRQLFFIDIFCEGPPMIGKPGPFQVIESDGCGLVESPMSPPRRRYSCKNYASCLDLAAALNWDNFTCRGCCGEVNESLNWRAHQESRKDSVVQTLCEIPEIRYHASSPPEETPVIPLKIAAKR